MLGKHLGVESAINNLEHDGLDRVRAREEYGFARSVDLSVLALNMHRIGLLLCWKVRELLFFTLFATLFDNPMGVE